MKYYRIDVELTTGFKYSYHCIERMKPGMVQASKSIWTKSVTENEITKEEFEETRNVKWEKEKKVEKVIPMTDNKPVKKQQVTKATESKTVKKTPKLSSLEDFFGEDDEPTDRPSGIAERSSISPKKTGRNSKADTNQKVRARRST